MHTLPQSIINSYNFLKGHDVNTKEISADGEGEDNLKPDDGGRTFASARNVVNYFRQATQKTYRMKDN